MAKNFKLSSSYFCGNKISDYGIEQGFLDYATLAKAFDAVLNNSIIENTCDIGYWDVVNGSELYYENEDGDTLSENEYSEKGCPDDYSECYNDIYQYFIVSDAGAEILTDYTNEIVFYNEALDMYVWGVTHWGTSWDYVLTDIPCNCDNE